MTDRGIIFSAPMVREPGERWEDNPWIVALKFRTVRENIDHISKSIVSKGGEK